jgi:pSer/pThr/pTyr-binding forkhead associated (FHA) protein
MGDQDLRFREACGVAGPLRLAWEADGLTGGQEVTLESPAAVVGRDPCAGVTIDHPAMERRQAYLQVVEGRLYAVGLGAKDPVRWDGVPRLSGWLDHGRSVQIGPATIRLLEGGAASGDRGLAVGPGPTSRRYVSQEPLPHVLLKFKGPGELRQGVELDRPLTLVGRSERCQIRLDHPGVSRLAISLVRTPVGLWVVDLLSRRGIRVNGYHCREARLEDGDVVDLGSWSLRVFLGARLPAPASPAGPLALALAPSAFPPSLNVTSCELPFESVLGSLLERGEPPPGLSSSPFGQALLMMVQLLGDVHRDHLELVRSELEQIRRLSHDISAIKAQAEPIPVLNPPVAAPNGSGKAVDPALAQEKPVESPERPDPSTVHDLVSERLVAWERERQSRWRKVLDLLVRS